MKKRLIKLSLFKKILVAFLAVVITLCSVYLFSYYSGMKLLTQERTDAVKIAGQNYLQSFDRQISKIKKAMFASHTNQDWTSLALKKGYVVDYETLKEVIVAQERIDAINSTSDVIENVSVNFPRWGRSISTSDGLSDYNGELWSSARMPTDSSGAQIVYVDNKPYLTTSYKRLTPELYSITTQISYEKFHRYYSDYGLAGVPINTYLTDLETDKPLFYNETISGADNTAISAAALSCNVETPFKVKIQNQEYICISGFSSYSQLRIVNVVKISDLTAPFIKQTRLVIIFTMLIAFLVAVMLFFIKRTVVVPINKLSQAFSEFEKGNFSVNLKSNTHDEFEILYSSFNQMVENLETLVYEVYEKELLVERANFKQLQSQINPHFLYNSFYALSTMIKLGDNESAEEFCMHLSMYFQYITRNNSETVSLAEDMRHAENYMRIMAMRNANIEIVPCEINKETGLSLKVPRLILQPLVENAFEHGYKHIEGRFVLKLHYTESKCEILITVENSGIVNDEELSALKHGLSEIHNIKEMTGVFNIHKRLRLFFGENSGLSVHLSKLGGLKVIVHIEKKGDSGNDISNISS